MVTWPLGCVTISRFVGHRDVIWDNQLEQLSKDIYQVSVDCSSDVLECAGGRYSYVRLAVSWEGHP